MRRLHQQQAVTTPTTTIITTTITPEWWSQQIQHRLQRQQLASPTEHSTSLQQQQPSVTMPLLQLLVSARRSGGRFRPRPPCSSAPHLPRTLPRSNGAVVQGAGARPASASSRTLAATMRCMGLTAIQTLLLC
jgi:hypothetical protein